MISAKREVSELKERVRHLEQSEAKLQSYTQELERLADAHRLAIQATQDVAVFALAKLADSRDPETGEHLTRMRDYAQTLGRHLSEHGPYRSEIDDEFLDSLYRSSPLHDIGKVGISDAILLKPGRLTTEEFETMKRHAAIGATTLREVARTCQSGGFFAMAARIAHYHHERWDGTGYPEGLKGLDIPLEARIVAVADVFDALTSKRVYKLAYTPQRAKSVIEHDAGRHFDPAIVEAFRECYDDFLKIASAGPGESERPATPHAERPRPQAGPQREPAASNHERVLVVASNPADLKTVSEWLATAGYDVIQAADAQQAIARIKQVCPQFVITDWKMPGLSGGDLCRWIRRERLPNQVYTLITTASTDSVDVVRSDQLGADELLAKPVQQRDLLARLRSASRIVQLEDQLRRLAHPDPLTGVPTRQLIDPQMEREWHRSARYRLPLSCLVLDIDHFEVINQMHGQDAGDAVLKIVAQTVLAYSRASDLVCRLAGDRFLVLLGECNETQAVLAGNRLRTAIDNASPCIDGRSMKVTASVGVAQRFSDTPSADVLIELAEQALGAAKQMGRDRTVSYRTLGDARNMARAASELQRRPLEGYTAKDVMSAPILCLRDSDSTQTATKFLVQYRINSAPVVDAEGLLAGILSEKDLICQSPWTDGEGFAIRRIMSADVVCFQEDDSAQEIFDFLAAAAIRRVIIVKAGKPTGVISRGTFLRWLSNRQSASPPGPADASGPRHVKRSDDGDAERAVAANVDQLAAEVCGVLSPSPQIAHDRAHSQPD
jgi:diguanylate cyclase (GGDEF)-like protein